MFDSVDQSLTFRTTSITQGIANNLCNRNGVKKKSDLHRMAYMIGLEVAMQLEKSCENDGELINKLAYHLVDLAKARV